MINSIDFIIGIDPGTNTGYAVFSVSEKTMCKCSTLPIHRALSGVKSYLKLGKSVSVYVEDARKITLPVSLQKHKGTAQLQGVGSVKRDCSIWQDFLEDMQREFPQLVKFEMVDPRRTIKKIDEKKFKMITGYAGKTSQHARDAAMLLVGRRQ